MLSLNMNFFMYDIDSHSSLGNCQGAQPMDEKTIPDDTEQIFVMSTDIVDCLKEDLAWASYVLLRNTNVIAMVNLMDYQFIMINLKKLMVG